MITPREAASSSNSATRISTEEVQLFQIPARSAIYNCSRFVLASGRSLVSAASVNL